MCRVADVVGLASHLVVGDEVGFVRGEGVVLLLVPVLADHVQTVGLVAIRARLEHQVRRLVELERLDPGLLVADVHVNRELDDVLVWLDGRVGRGRTNQRDHDDEGDQGDERVLHLESSGNGG